MARVSGNAGRGPPGYGPGGGYDDMGPPLDPIPGPGMPMGQVSCLQVLCCSVVFACQDTKVTLGDVLYPISIGRCTRPQNVYC